MFFVGSQAVCSLLYTLLLLFDRNQCSMIITMTKTQIIQLVSTRPKYAVELRTARTQKELEDAFPGSHLRHGTRRMG